MGWVIFSKVEENSEWVTYKYSHDCYDMDGVIKVKKVKKLSDGDFLITPSKSDSMNNYFAFKIIIQIRKWINNDSALPDRYSLALG